MAKFSIRFKASVAKDLRAIPKQDVIRILERIDALAENPRADGCIKLSGNRYYRVRQGLYRIVYDIQDEQLVILVIKIAHLSNVYEQL